MKTINKTSTIVLLTIALAGCAAPKPKAVQKAPDPDVVTLSDMRKADYGEQPDRDEALARIADYTRRTLIDPDSMKLRCNQTFLRGWARDYPGKQPNFGWVLTCYVNAKNRFGGYTGEQEHLFVFNGNTFSHWQFPTDFLRSVNTGFLD